MLDEHKQKQLAETVPLGMMETPTHLKYRDQITAQQAELANLGEINQKIQPLTTDQLQANFPDMRIGVTDLDPNYLFQHHQIPANHQKVIIIVCPMDYEKMITAPSLTSATEILKSYRDGGERVIKLTRYLRDKGYDVLPHHPMGDINEYHHILMPPHAVAAGLGERGRTGLFIDYIYGPTVRLAALTTSADLDNTKGEHKGITEFCHRCRYCVRYCPPNALPDGTYMEEVESGEPMDFKINAHRCFQYFKQHQGCGKCIVNCILAEPDTETIARRMNRISSWYEKWVVSGKLDEMYAQELTSQT